MSSANPPRRSSTAAAARTALIPTLIAALVVALLSACSACTSRSSSTDSTPTAAISATTSAARGLVFGTIDEPDTLDPLFTQVSSAQEIVRLLFRDLTDYDETWSLHPSLAQSLPAIETTTTGAQRIRWKLRPNLKWSDGHPLTAADVAFGYQIARDPTLEVISQQMTEEISRVVPAGELELIVDWRRSYPTYGVPRTHPILPRHAYPDPKTSPRPFRGLGRQPISSGPYRLAEWIPGQYLRLERNPHWTGPIAPELPAITWRFFGREDAFEVELKSGGIDALGEASGLSVERASGLEERLASTHVVHYTDSGLWLHLELRADHPALADLRVRKAIHRAIDRQAMARIVYGGRATPSFAPFAPRHPAHREHPEEQPDPTESKRLLAEAKHEKLALELQFASGTQASERAAAFLKAELAKVGVEVTLAALNFRVLMSKMRDKQHAPLVLFAWRSNPDWDANAMLHSTGAQNYGGFKDAELDRVLDEAKSARDPKTWAEALARVEARYRSVLPSIPLLFRQAVSVRPKSLEGWRPTGSQTPVTWNAETWRWSDNRK